MSCLLKCRAAGIDAAMVLWLSRCAEGVGGTRCLVYDAILGSVTTVVVGHSRCPGTAQKQ